MRSSLLLLVASVASTGCSRVSRPADGAGGSGERRACASVERLDPTAPRCGGAAPVEERPASARATFGCRDVRLTVTAIEAGILRLQYGTTGDPPAPRSFAVNLEDAPAPPLVEGRACEAVRLCTRALAVEVDPESCRVIAVAGRGGARLIEDAPSESFVSNRGQPVGPGLRITRQLDPRERLHGLGNRVGALDLRGRVLTAWNTDAYDPAVKGFRNDADPLYLSVPFVLSHRPGLAYGLFTDNPTRLSFDLGATDPNTWTIAAAGGFIDQYLLAGPTPKEVLRRYVFLTGGPALPARWALGFHQSRWGYPTQEAVIELAQTFRARRLPADAIWLDIQHMDGFRSFTFDPKAFPAPRSMTEALSSLGFRTVAIVDPGLKVDETWPLYQQAARDGHLLLDAEGRPYEGRVWPGASAFPDFSAATTRTWWGDQVKRLTEVGVAGVWLDMNEPATFDADTEKTLPLRLSGGGDGSPVPMASLHNVYALLQAQATFEGLSRHRPLARPFVLTRAGFAGIQRYAGAWTGDVQSSWEGLRQTLPTLLNLGLSGIPFVGSDVGGFTGHASAELYVRWLQLGMVSPFFRAHVTKDAPGQEPWTFGPEVEQLARDILNERSRLVPYLYSLLAQSVTDGAPLLRPVFFEFPDTAQAIEDQAFLGPWLLVAPVLQAGANVRRLWLPGGEWLEQRSGRLFEGPGTIELPVTLGDFPVLLREGAIVPRGPVRQFDGEASGAGAGATPGPRREGPAAALPEVLADALELDLFPSRRETAFSLYEDAGDGAGPARWTTFTLQRTKGGARFTRVDDAGAFRPARRTLLLRVRKVEGAPTGVDLDGHPLAALPTAAALHAAARGHWYDPEDRSLWVAVDDAPLELSLTYGAPR